ncbi:hypothetical protein [Bradyrhizobium diazoefficiens]|uniref:hypothetical protein n=1 Tax=Bradyrhizobium diazoefficiens TaxID=1355477 RepID=UPI00272C29FF|nr:hypothetical protein [Bradyrhizobium diazoefficiens]WLA64706.1 hypothetical protein QNN01_41690 [Bradyrhizobium diazoefficiens]
MAKKTEIEDYEDDREEMASAGPQNPNDRLAAMLQIAGGLQRSGFSCSVRRDRRSS